MTQPNIVFIYIDQLTFRAMGAYGNEVARTPAMDRMAREGVTFDRFYANSAICGPSRFAVYTGQMPFHHPNWATPNCACVPLFPYMGELFEKRGYKTGSVGKLHGIPEDFDFGFEHCRQNWGFGTGFPFNAYGHWVSEKLKGRRDAEQIRREIASSRPGPHAGSNADYYYLPWELSEEAWLVEETESFLQDCPHNKPFLLNLGFRHPHLPWQTIPGPDEAYEPVDAELPVNHEMETPILEACSRGGGHITDSPCKTPEMWRRFIARYYTAVTQVDRAIGEVFRLLERYAPENTVVVLNTDHGEMLGEYGRCQKGVFYESAVRTPFLVWGPGVPEGQRREQLAEQVDIIPTLLDFAGFEIPDDFQGMSLKPVIQDGRETTKSAVHAWLEHHGLFHAMTRTEEHKLYRLTGRGVEGEIFELYNVDEDPYEINNLWPECNEDGSVEAVKRAFAQFFWQNAGMRGCSPKTADALGVPVPFRE